MKPITIVGILLIAIGIISLVYQGITYTTREKILEIGPIEAHKEEKKTIPLPPILGGLALAGGIVLVIYGAKK
jgi:hypothetical protein